jgi:hypothetical protein
VHAFRVVKPIGDRGMARSRAHAPRGHRHVVIGALSEDLLVHPVPVTGVIKVIGLGRAAPPDMGRELDHAARIA